MSNVMCITGASSGIGLETAKRFAQKGWAVYAGTRNVERDAKEHAMPNLTFMHMEVTDPASLERVYTHIEKEHGRIDVLFANAGYGLFKPLENTTQEEIENMFQTNVFGVIHTINGALPLLKKAEQPYVLATSSVGGLVGQPFNEVYCASKFALEGLIESLATYYKPLFNIDMTLLEPAGVATQFAPTVLKNIEQAGLGNPEYMELISTVQKNFSARNTAPQTPAQVAEVVEELVTMKEKPLRHRTSEAAEAFTQYKTAGDADGLKGMKFIQKMQLSIEN
ncbi:short-chain dehydrogenase/reductase SDR [Fictibacillus macauensis ZFHKF-1]|uniref:Short-chain dehydrogenase/reductase SDR n=1 Tax=Fictibacillus macauensis ZFHKF-1 TaxID=1196324 RepID=I8U9N0_9BACL|nr:SDR family oxidoreductase [Fictibacillus macauensis]EIT83660.1 short-chain dehydrogenase/reductase SDR [Fictibacillus macauensis ZFHKF-1]